METSTDIVLHLWDCRRLIVVILRHFSQILWWSSEFDCYLFGCWSSAVCLYQRVYLIIPDLIITVCVFVYKLSCRHFLYYQDQNWQNVKNITCYEYLFWKLVVFNVKEQFCDQTLIVWSCYLGKKKVIDFQY